jgi:hypothetical protein
MSPCADGDENIRRYRTWRDCVIDADCSLL